MQFFNYYNKNHNYLLHHTLLSSHAFANQHILQNELVKWWGPRFPLSFRSRGPISISYFPFLKYRRLSPLMLLSKGTGVLSYFSLNLERLVQPLENPSIWKKTKIIIIRYSQPRGQRFLSISTVQLDRIVMIIRWSKSNISLHDSHYLPLKQDKVLIIKIKLT